MIKELVMEVTNSLPDTATFDDIIEAIYTRIKIEKGLNAVKEEKETECRNKEASEMINPYGVLGVMVIIWTTPAVS